MYWKNTLLNGAVRVTIMNISENSQSLGSSLSAIGLILPPFLETGSPDKLPQATFNALLSYLPDDLEGKEQVLQESLKIMAVWGLICDESGRIQPTSRSAYFTLASFAKYLEAGVPIVSKPISHDEKEYLTSFTKILESIRSTRKDVDNKPIHRRRIINILIKSRQNRQGRKQDVFLHAYHPQWGAYHLIGLSRKKELETDKTLIEMAMDKQLNMSKDQYEIDNNFNPREFVIEHISETSGALTEYTYRLFRVEKFASRLALKELVEKAQTEAKIKNTKARFDNNSFRWFTVSEIAEGQSIYGEKIMFSSKYLLDKYNLAQTPVNAPDADDMRYRISLSTELGNRISITFVVVSVGFVILSLLVFLFTHEILSFLGTPNTYLDNLSQLARIINPVLTLLGLYLGYKRSQT